MHTHTLTHNDTGTPTHPSPPTHILPTSPFCPSRALVVNVWEGMPLSFYMSFGHLRNLFGTLDQSKKLVGMCLWCVCLHCGQIVGHSLPQKPKKGLVHALCAPPIPPPPRALVLCCVWRVMCGCVFFKGVPCGVVVCGAVVCGVVMGTDVVCGSASSADPGQKVLQARRASPPPLSHHQTLATSWADYSVVVCNPPTPPRPPKSESPPRFQMVWHGSDACPPPRFRFVLCMLLFRLIFAVVG